MRVKIDMCVDQHRPYCPVVTDTSDESGRFLSSPAAVAAAWGLLHMAVVQAHNTRPGNMGEMRGRAVLDLLGALSEQWLDELGRDADPAFKVELRWCLANKEDPGFTDPLATARQWAGGCHD